jgi:hypothetical protein
LATGSVDTTIGELQWSPPSVERRTPVNEAFGASRPEPLPKWKMSTSVPSGSTAIWFPIVKMFWLGPICRGADHVPPPSVVSE